jgi:hypothetical protein
LHELAYEIDLEVKGAKSHIRELGEQLHICEENNMKMHEEKPLSVPHDIRPRSSDVGQTGALLQQAYVQASVERPIRPAANCAWPPAQSVSIWLIS